MSKLERIPKYRLHKPSGQAIVTLNGRDIYLGPWASKTSRQRYDQLVAEWLAAGRRLPAPGGLDDLTVAEVIDAFWRGHVTTYYRRADGTPTSEVENYRQAMRPLRELYGRTSAAGFGPRALRAMQQKMIDLGWCRGQINKQVGRIKTMFRWAVGRELLPAAVHQALLAVPGLRRGRTEARESDPVRPAALVDVEAVRPHVSRQVWAMIELQLLTAARPGEIAALRPMDVDTSGDVWTYTPGEHKTAHHGHERAIFLGPKAQEILRPFLLRPSEAFCFSPAEAEQHRREIAHAERTTPLSCGNSPGTNRRRRPRRQPGQRYDTSAYAHAVRRACDLALPPPGELARREGETERARQARLTPQQADELRAWRKAHRWHPHQLRHTAATALRKEHGLDVARVVLGHRSAAVTEIYAEVDQQRARTVIAGSG